jgi:hypothetical protein
MVSVNYPLYHGMRSHKSAEEIKKEGFCAYGDNEKENILKALKFFNKLYTINQKGYDSDLIRMNLETVDRPHRKVAWASADRTAACGWWANANPEHISDSMLHAGVDPKQINTYLNKEYGKNCYIVKLKQRVEFSPSNPPPNVSLNKNCIIPKMIEDVRQCGFCNYEKAKKLRPNFYDSQKRLGTMFGFEW